MSQHHKILWEDHNATEKSVLANYMAMYYEDVLLLLDTIVLLKLNVQPQITNLQDDQFLFTYMHNLMIYNKYVLPLFVLMP
ncbi:hypothetical protein V1478_017661 [Vespula squamosa]|uniref:Uncharacterized protein n=1 Tax=Vespula squamosa TaxID=30214 RepID=A0ABD1ZWH0_VESSQ